MRLLLLFFFLLTVHVYGTQYKFINGKVVPVNPLDQSDEIYEIDNKSIVQALISYESEISYMKLKLKRIEKDIKEIKSVNETFKRRMDRFIIKYNRRF